MAGGLVLPALGSVVGPVLPGLAGSGAGVLHAQVSPADSAAVLQSAAEDFEVRGDWAVARALYEAIVRRYPGTPAAEVAQGRLAALAAAGRAGVPSGQDAGPSSAAQGGPGGDAGDRGGDTSFRVWSSLYGAWVGIAIPTLAGADGSEPYGVGLLLGGPVGYLGGRLFSNARALSPAEARSIAWAGTWGTWQGFGWAQTLGRRRDPGCPTCPRTLDPTAEVTVGAALGGGLAGVIAGALLTGDGVSEGTAAATYLGSLWGSWFGLAGAATLDFDDTETWASTLTGGNAGLLAGALIGRHLDISSRQAHLTSLGGLIGGLGGVGIVLIAQPSGSQGDWGIILGSSAVGLTVGAILAPRGDGFAAGPLQRSGLAVGSGAGGAAAGSGRGASAGGRSADGGLTDGGRRDRSPTLLPGALFGPSPGGGISLGLPLPYPSSIVHPDDVTRRGIAWNIPLLNLRF